MINDNEYEILKSQLKKIFKSAKMTNNDVVVSRPEFDELQHALVYLSDCIHELHTFTSDICRGDLDGPQPSRHNYLVGNLKELHSVMRHLTWQTKQVAEGDYNQRLSFLGDFSVSFNQMIIQLEERERRLRETATHLEQSNDFLRTIMDAHKDWIVVENLVRNEIVYNNRMSIPVSTPFLPENFSCEKISVLDGVPDIGTSDTIIYLCKEDNRYYSVSSYPIIWNGVDAKVYYISDITQNRLEQKNLSEMAYIDQLTGAYNRRYCIQQANQFISRNFAFSLVMIDLNALKYVNDTFGHSEGDNYITSVTSIIKQHSRDTDILCRIGGDEFIILLKNCTLEVSEQKIQQMITSLDKLQNDSYVMSISYGITYVDEYCSRPLDDIINESDEKMYKYKQAYKKTLEV